MPAPVQMTSKTLNARKGWPSLSAVDYVAKLSANVTLDPVPPGSCVHLNSVGEFELGVGNNIVMPMFTFNGSNDPDAINDGGDPTTEERVYVGIVPDNQANIVALVAIGGYELVSTRYASGQSYTPNTLLTSPANNVNGGYLTPGVLGTNTIVGVVSSGLVDNGYGFTAVAFWPVFLPVYP